MTSESYGPALAALPATIKAAKRRELSACVNRFTGLTVLLSVKPVLHSSLLAALGLTLSAAAPIGAAEWRALLDASPFGPQPAGSSVAAPTKPEFRGLVQDSDGLMISLFDPQSKTSQWITVPGHGPGLEVKSYDPIAQTVTVIQGVREITLRLKEAHVSRLAPPGAPPSGRPGADADDAGKDAARVTPRAIRDLPPDIRRLAEEYLRRRRTPDPGNGDQPVRAGKP